VNWVPISCPFFKKENDMFYVEANIVYGRQSRDNLDVFAHELLSEYFGCDDRSHPPGDKMP